MMKMERKMMMMMMRKEIVQTKTLVKRQRTTSLRKMRRKMGTQRPVPFVWTG